MSTLKELLKKHCPDGVEYKTLEDVCIIYTGEQLNRKNMIKEGYPVINGGIQASGYTNNFNEYEETITISQGGASAGFVNFMLEKFWAGAHCYIIKPNTDKLINKYLFFVLKNIEIHIMELKNGAGIPGINKNKITKIKIPLPPIEVQKEIVRILDEFTEKTIKLQELLHRETILRKKQYEYYRDKLLTFGDDVPLKKLGDIAIDIYRGTGIKKDEVTEKGIPCVRYGEIYTKYNIWFDKCFSHTIEENIKNRKYFEYGDVLFAITGESVKEISKSCVYIGHDKCLAGGDIVVLKHNQNPKYMGYVLSTTNAQIQKSKGKVKSKVVHSNVQDISDILIPVPPLEEQKRIVNILDKFDALCNDITSGLPAEIELRKKQYEYYRDKLLTFKEKKV
ncbi:restriction endonuclease subunit S [Brachyspira pilosicoli]|uniref:restriction endonuclease subunit S n=1 Tax=Brachyspira pilosicoli TaxID=52584 RepID=UPI001CA4ED71|nr:restriction endonuclease subunit S [Brachyspira pilosicoli]MBW5393186.1 restriction endonuclease subunit S [Brachyspira pilosicoli]